MRKRISKLSINLSIFGVCASIYAQQSPTYTQYMYNPTVINPAYASTKESMSFFGLYRNQWVGIEGAPKTANVGFTTPIDSQLGVGVNFVNDHIGAMDENNLSFDLAYTLNLNEQYKLALGLKGTLSLLSLSYSKLNIFDQSRPFAYEDVKNKFTPNIGAGAYLFSDVAYLGLSVPKVFKADYYDGIKEVTMRQRPLLYLMGGYVFDLGSDWMLKPTFMSKIGNGQSTMDLAANFLYQEKFTIGTAYRWNSSVSALAGFQIDNHWFIGYAYDFDTTKWNKYNTGTHEIFMRFDWIESFKTGGKRKSSFF